MSAKKVNRRSIQFYILAMVIVFVLLLSAINIDNYLKPRTITVLAAETETTNVVFWRDFLSHNPDYIPGWNEMGREDKVWSIDPNYLSR